MRLYRDIETVSIGYLDSGDAESAPGAIANTAPTIGAHCGTNDSNGAKHGRGVKSFS